MRGGPANGEWGGRRPFPLPFALEAAGETRARHILCATAARTGPRGPSARAMTDLRTEYAARAATFRKLAEALKSEADRAALLAIAEEYEEEAARRKPGAGG